MFQISLLLEPTVQFSIYLFLYMHPYATAPEAWSNDSFLHPRFASSSLVIQISKEHHSRYEEAFGLHPFFERAFKAVAAASAMSCDVGFVLVSRRASFLDIMETRAAVPDPSKHANKQSVTTMDNPSRSHPLYVEASMQATCPRHVSNASIVAATTQPIMALLPANLSKSLASVLAPATRETKTGRTYLTSILTLDASFPEERIFVPSFDLMIETLRKTCMVFLMISNRFLSCAGVLSQRERDASARSSSSWCRCRRR